MLDVQAIEDLQSLVRDVPIADDLVKDVVRLVLADLEDLADIGVIERGSRHRLLAEAFPRVLVGGHLGRQQLDGHLTVEARIARTVHHTHAALTNGTQDLVRTKASSGDKGHGVSNDSTLNKTFRVSRWAVSRAGAGTSNQKPVTRNQPRLLSLSCLIAMATCA